MADVSAEIQLLLRGSHDAQAIRNAKEAVKAALSGAGSAPETMGMTATDLLTLAKSGCHPMRDLGLTQSSAARLLREAGMTQERINTLLGGNKKPVS